MNEIRKPSKREKILASTFAHNWSDARNVSASQIIAAMLGLSVPIIVGAATGHLQSGVAAALGGFAMGMQQGSGALRSRISNLFYALITGSAAIFIGAVLSAKGVATLICIPAVAAAAGLFGSISRPLARSTAQFIVFLIIAANMNVRGTSPACIAILFASGALWTAALSLSLTPLFRAFRPLSDRHGQADVAQPAHYSTRQLLRRWRKSLGHLAGWQYTIRITLCLIVAEITRLLWPHDHSYWISLTVAIVVHRNLQSALTRTFQRATGTALGVLLISMLLLGMPPLWAVIALAAVLAAARPVLFNVNYIVYAAVTTPLIILLLDFGKPPSPDIIAARLIATLIGCLIGLILGYTAWSRFAGSSQPVLTGRK